MTEKKVCVASGYELGDKEILGAHSLSSPASSLPNMKVASGEGATDPSQSTEHESFRDRQRDTLKSYYV